MPCWISTHPLPRTTPPPPPPPIVSAPISVSQAEIARAIKSFPLGSSAGPDGLRPQHLKDILSSLPPDTFHSPFLSALADFSSLVLEGNTPPPVRPYFFGARLIALDKHGGGVRPIAIGCVLRRLVAKLACFRVSEDMAEVFSPLQLGFGVKGGIEAAVHAGRHFLDSLSPDEAVVKLDFRNAFNSVRRDRMLHSVLSVCPAIFPLVFSAYSASSSLFWEDRILLSSEGVQQGDPLGPLLFCITLHHFLAPLRSSFRVAYLDDVTLGGSVASLCKDISTLKGAEDIGFFLNPLKSEVISNCSDTIESIHSVLPGAVVVSPDSCYLLGSPIGNSSTLSSAIDQKVSALKLMGERLSLFSLHDSMLLLRSSLFHSMSHVHPSYFPIVSCGCSQGV